MNRRLFLKSGVVSAQVAVAVSAGLLLPSRVIAADWPSDAFHQTEYAKALRALFGNDPVIDSDRVRITAKKSADNGATVPVQVDTDLPLPLTVMFFSPENPTPALGRFMLTPEMEGHVKTRIKMAKTGDVVAVVTSGGEHYRTSKRIVVAAGGCA